MVDLRFDIKSLFPQRIVKVTSELVPTSFHGNRYEVTDAKLKTCEIIDTLGELSASAQSLNMPITTHQKLRQDDNQTIYLLADPTVKPRGVAIGLLKVGKKDLVVYNKNGERYQVKSPCVLDFFIHPSYQRVGFGRELFDTMLADEKLQPDKWSIDRPSEKMISFMNKHYGLQKTIPQPNHFVLFEGYFDNKNSDAANRQQPCRVQYIAKKIPSHNNYGQLPRIAVKRFETVPDYSMAEIIQKFGKY